MTCPECIEPDEDPAPWCDCRPDETCKGPCRKRAHEPERCPNRWAEEVTERAKARYRPENRPPVVPAPRRSLETLAPGDRTPRNLASVQRAAEAADWVVSVAALGDSVGTWHAVLARKDGKAVLVCWVDGRFDAAVCGRDGRLLASVGFREVKGIFND